MLGCTRFALAVLLVSAFSAAAPAQSIIMSGSMSAGGSVAFGVTGAFPNAPIVLFLGNKGGSTGIVPGVTIDMSSAVVFTITRIDPFGRLMHTVPIPSVPFLSGLTVPFSTQGLIVDPTRPIPKQRLSGLAKTNVADFSITF